MNMKILSTFSFFLSFFSITHVDGMRKKIRPNINNKTVSKRPVTQVSINPDALTDEEFNKLFESGCFNNVQENPSVIIDISDEEIIKNSPQQTEDIAQNNKKRDHSNIIENNNNINKKQKNQTTAQHNSNKQLSQPLTKSDAISDEELNKLLKSGALGSEPMIKKNEPKISKQKNNHNQKLSLQKSSTPRGLKNFGASCYFNAGVQCLAQSQMLIPALLHAQDHYVTQENVKKFPVPTALIKLLLSMQSSTSKNVIEPTELYNLVITHRFDKSRQQQCAYQNLGFLIEQLTDPLFDKDKVFQNIFQSSVNKKTRCSNKTCSYESQKIEPYTIFDLPINQTNQQSSLKTTIENFFSKATTSDWKCYACNNKGSQNTYTFAQAPELFMVNLKRYKYVEKKEKNRTVLTPVKIKTAVSFPVNGLDMTHYIHPNNQNTSAMYDLIGIVMHRGEISVGHYLSFVKNIDENYWLYCNDSQVQKKQNNALEDLAKTGLFYEPNEKIKAISNAFLPSILIYKKRA